MNKEVSNRADLKFTFTCSVSFLSLFFFFSHSFSFSFLYFTFLFLSLSLTLSCSLFTLNLSNSPSLLLSYPILPLLDCPNDTLVQAVGTLTSKNIAVSVAAGNEGTHAQYVLYIKVSRYFSPSCTALSIGLSRMCLSCLPVSDCGSI